MEHGPTPLARMENLGSDSNLASATVSSLLSDARVTYNNDPELSCGGN